MSGMLPLYCFTFPHQCGNIKALGWPFMAGTNQLTSWSRWNWDIQDRVHEDALNQPIPFFHIYLRYIFILFRQLNLDFTKFILPSDFRLKFL